MQYIISNIKLPFYAEEDEIINDAVNRMKRASLYNSALHFRLYKRSLDARNKENIFSVSSVIAECPDECAPRFDEKKGASFGITCIKDIAYGDTPVKKGDIPLAARPLVVGMGPCGLFAALFLAENGYSPIIIDRGDDVAKRVKAVERFYSDGTLDTESNIQFGAGGAGTFSDGKLVTRINDPRCSYVLKRLAELGAPSEILTKAKPHVGTDVLRDVVSNVIDRIKALGGRVEYRCRLDGIKEFSDGSILAKTSKGDIKCGAVLLATGHSARDTYEKLDNGSFGGEFLLVPKQFSVGVRVEHLQEDIDRALFGKYAGHEKIGKGEYNLSDTSSGRGVYTFCMCPGGEVVGAASEELGVVVNGMSNHARNGRNANCAVAVSVFPDDIRSFDGASPIMSAIEFQRKLERAAYNAGGSGYYAPVQMMGSFLGDNEKIKSSRIVPTYMGGKVREADLNEVLPNFICEELRRGFRVFDKRIRGFASADVPLTAVESRTTSPIRIQRGTDLLAVGHSRIFPCGEGAGYAGGITSAAVDGLRCAEALVSSFSPTLTD